MSDDPDLQAAADEELARAATLGWRQLAKVAPWGDTYEGFSPLGRDVCFERAYLWEGERGGAIRVEVTVYAPTEYEKGVRRLRSIPPELGPAAAEPPEEGASE